METTIAITNKWQIHIPKALRKALGLTKPGMVRLTAKRGAITITPKKGSILDYAGKYHDLYKKKPVNIDRIRDLIDYSEA